MFVKCAIQGNADYIITRNMSDFKASPVNSITAEEFVVLEQFV
jgi:hypothetical protein